jgi:CPA2 family monovalent cation:H+ antiporter-2
MHSLAFIQDMAVIMLIAGAVTVLFHRFRQPVVLGYIIAGVIIGPHTPPINLIHDENTINILAELGVVFLLFSLGLEFSFRKLLRVGSTAFIAALLEIIVMIWIGIQIGNFFGWNSMDSLFLGAILSISSTTIIIKALDNLQMKKEKFAQLIFGVLIVEDILAIGLIALLSTIATTGEVDSASVLLIVGKLVLFIIISLVIGIMLVPRMLQYVARYQSNEMLLITVLGICFGFCLIVISMGYSIALGAFIIGAIMAESRQIHKVENLIEPVRDMFSAIFFVTIGLMLNPAIIMDYFMPVAIITIAVVAGKLISCGTGAFIAGNDGRTSLRVGMGLSQIGEFSFIIASLGMTLNVTSPFLYQITVAVSAVTTLLTPYLIKLADPLSKKITESVPYPLARILRSYSDWLSNLRQNNTNETIKKMIRRIIMQLIINFAIVIFIFLAAAYFSPQIFKIIPADYFSLQVKRAILWGVLLLLSMPFLIAIVRKLKGLSMILAELSMKSDNLSNGHMKIRAVIAEIIPVVAIILIMLLIFMLSSAILPTLHLLILVLVIVAIIAFFMWKKFIWIHAKLQDALKENIDHH